MTEYIRFEYVFAPQERQECQGKMCTLPSPMRSSLNFGCRENTIYHDASHVSGIAILLYNSLIVSLKARLNKKVLFLCRPQVQ